MCKIKLKYIILIVLIGILMFFIMEKTNRKINMDSIPDFITDEEGLYAHAKLGIDSKEAWQRWNSYKGTNAEVGCKYFLLPKSVDDNYIEIYNNYNEDIWVSNINVKPKKICLLKYIEGEKIIVSKGNDTCELIIKKSNADASVFINDTINNYKDYNGEVVCSDLYSFLIKDKRNYVSDIKCTIVNNNEVIDTKLKKIKGRGNSTWYEQEKKPFNITFYNSTTIGNTRSKKFSILSNGCDKTMLRNKIIFDLSNDVGLPYSPNISYIDFYINGDYKGCFLACEKVDMGKNELIKLDDNYEKKNINFNFLVEVDCWNYYYDTFFETNKGYKIVIKNPDLKDLEDDNKKYNYIKETYQKFEDMLYDSDTSLNELEKICDLNSFATMYLIQEFCKNIDGGFSSTFFTYNAEEEKFYAMPIWDCDSTFGEINIIREGYNLSTCNYKGWLIKDAKYNGVVNALGQCFNIKGKTNDGETFEDICKKLWNEKFVPNINIILGKVEPKENLMSIDQYKINCEKALYNNFIKWNIGDFYKCNESRIQKTYNTHYNCEFEYLKDWIEARANWMTDMFNSKTNEEENVNYYLVGDNFGGWENRLEENKIIKNSNGKYSITKTFNANVKYLFKIVDSENEFYNPNFYNPAIFEYCKIDKKYLNAECIFSEDTILTITLDGDYFNLLPTMGKDNTEKCLSFEKKDIYFRNTLNWDSIYYYTEGNYLSEQWPGKKAEFVKKDKDGVDVYRASVEEDKTKIVFNNGGIEEKTEEIDFIKNKDGVVFEPKDYYLFRTFKIYQVEEVENYR